MSAKKAATTQKSSGLKFQPDEIEWLPVHSAHTYQYLGHDRVALTVDAPHNFSGRAGTYKLVVEKSSIVVLKVPIDEVHMNPHDVHSLLAAEFGRIFAADSIKELSKNQMAKKMFKNGNGNTKFATFRMKLPFPCEKDFADD